MILSKMKMLSLLFFMMIGTSTLMAQADVTNEEVEKFAVTFQKMRMLNQEAQKELSEVISSEGMEVSRFNTLYQAQMDPETEADFTEDEEQKFNVIIEELNKRQTVLRAKVEDMIKENGLTMERYEQIGNQLQNDAALQERVRQELID